MSRTCCSRDLQLHATGDQGPVTKSGKAVHLPLAVRGRGGPAHLCTGPCRAAARAAHSLADAYDRGETFYAAVGRLHLATRHEQEGGDLVTANGGQIVGEEYYPLDHRDYRETVGGGGGKKIAASSADVVFNTIVRLAYAVL